MTRRTQQRSPALIAFLRGYGSILDLWGVGSELPTRVVCRSRTGWAEDRARLAHDGGAVMRDLYIAIGRREKIVGEEKARERREEEQHRDTDPGRISAPA